MGEEICVRSPRLLAGRLRDCGGYEERIAVPVRRSELASCDLTMLVGFADPVVVSPAAAYVSLLAGPRDVPATTGLSGVQHGVRLTLDPLTAYSLFGVPLRLLRNDAVDLGALLGADAERLIARLAEAPRWARRFELLDAALGDLLVRGPAPDPGVVWAYRRLRTTRDVRIAELAERLGWSRRHLARRFADQVGLRPKTVARISRLQHAVTLLAVRPRAGAHAAAAAGYADQAHLVREARALTGSTPTQLAQGSHSFKPISGGARTFGG
ncbi:helix-turn-helix domain-containing protein [Nonomuraea sp. K274]|uniref:Helix-turn-helix domain-containing protein n=1 Tax=Nonomuraea cypriaca TaxID=1187855 RepID=A0A931ABB4_9ACTN|nr:helix-turn-helix domain-containing protein [Nonomuraea cypriaca]MBF8189676.1 helix-turn-helix domain-containing protein [Nonomuraea cypriaca]